MMADLSVQIIKSVCQKGKLSCIINAFKKWSRLDDEQLALLGKCKTKLLMMKTVFKFLKMKDLEMTTDIAGDLELAYNQLNPERKLWKAYRLKGNSLKWDQDPRSLRSKLVRELQAKWSSGIVYGNLSCYAGATWFRVHFDTSKRKRRRNSRTRPEDYNSNNSVFFLHFQDSPFLVVSQTRIREMEILSQALVSVFNAEGLSYMQLSDRNLYSLPEIVLRRKSKLSVQRHMTLEDRENIMLGRGSKRKLDDDEDDLDTTDSIVNENLKEKQQQRMEVDRKFGEGQQPPLQRIEYKFQVGFHGGSATDVSMDCKLQVDVKGASVLQGLKQMAKRGLMTFPLPQHITGVISNQRNRFSVISNTGR